MDGIERVVSDAVDKDAMHRLIDELPEDGLAILYTAQGADQTWWSVYGHSPQFRDIIGLIETAKLKMVEQHFSYQREDEGRS